MASLRVCLLAPDLLPVWGGAGTYAIEIARELSRRVDLTILTLERNNSGNPYSRAQMEEFFEHRVRVEVISEARENFRYNAAFQVAVLRQLPALVRAEKFDLVHSQHAHMPDLLYRRFNHSPPLLRTVHSTIAGQRAGIAAAQRFGGELEPSEAWQIALEPVLRAAEWVTLRDSDQLVAVSHYTRDELCGLGLSRDEIQVVYNGVRVDRFRPDARAPTAGLPSTRNPVVLYSGRPTLLKGIGVLLDAIPEILSRVPAAQFAFAGGSAEEFRSFAEGRNLPMDHLHFLGKLRYEELPGAYASADVAVAPTFRDSLPFWILEAMSSGVPVVASRIGGIPELVADGRTGVLIPPGSPRALADAVVPILVDPDRREELGRAARTSAVERFTWARAAEETLALYRSTASGHESE